MATATDTRNGAQVAADETSKATLQAYEAVSDYYLSAFDTGLKLQARWIETAKLLLDESAAFQRANRKLAEELLSSTRKAQQDLVGAFDASLRAAPTAWMPADKR
jgi:hypothetical protein